MKFSIKHFLLFTFLFLEFFSMMALASVPVRPVVTEGTDPSKSRITISISIVIARRRDCEGFGICDWSIGIDRKLPNSCSGNMYLDDYNKSIVVFEINKRTGISAEAYQKYFASGSFLMEDDSQVPDSIARELGLTAQKTLIAGKHKVTEKNGMLYVSIPVK